MNVMLYVITGFHREADKNCALLGYYPASCNVLPTFRDNLPVPSLRTSPESAVLNNISIMLERLRSWALKVL